MDRGHGSRPAPLCVFVGLPKLFELLPKSLNITLKNISKSFSKRKVLDDVSIKVNQGECLGILGPNGSGKTTILNLIMGILDPDYGNIILKGKNA